MEARRTGEARKPIIGSRPVAGRPRVFFGLAFIDISHYWCHLKASGGKAVTSAPALTQPQKGSNMAKAKRVHSTPRRTASKIPALPSADPGNAEYPVSIFGKLPAG